MSTAWRRERVGEEERSRGQSGKALGVRCGERTQVGQGIVGEGCRRKGQKRGESELRMCIGDALEARKVN